MLRGHSQVAGAVRIDRFSDVMSGGQQLGPQFTGLVQQQAEFDVAVAAHAGVGCVTAAGTLR